ncbi:unnamed protein product [Discosporangium mesarthrocarpum]
MVKGHLYLMVPPSRQITFYPNYGLVWEGASNAEWCPHCLQGGGVGSVRERGGGQAWPLKALYDQGHIADNGNFLEPEDVSARHGICGDPAQGKPDDDNRYSIANSNFEVLATYVKGSVIEIKTVTSTYHWGHLEFFICDANDLDDPDGPVTQSCLNQYPLDRAEDDKESSPIDPAHRGRYFLDPACRASETDQTLIPAEVYGGQVSTMRYKLPNDLTCSRCILQMIYCEEHYDFSFVPF